MTNLGHNPLLDYEAAELVKIGYDEEGLEFPWLRAAVNRMLEARAKRAGTLEISALAKAEPHVDDFIDDHRQDAYARWFFNLQRLPAILKADFSKWIAQYQLYCDYEGKRWRVTGCSRFGDVWITSNFKQDMGYEHRVQVTSCKGWSDKP